MSSTWNAASLLEPVSPDEPCGKSLEDTDALSALDAYQIFGQATLDVVPGEVGDATRRESRKSNRPPNWDEVRDLSLDLLSKSKDLRVLAHLAAALLRIEGVQTFGQTLAVASHWLVTYWSQTYPPLDEDGIFRRNALNNFADPVAIVDGLRRAPLVTSRQHGRFSLRDLDLAAGVVNSPGTDPKPEDARIAAAFAEMPIAELKVLQESAVTAVTSLKTIDETMRREAGIEGAPTFDPLIAQYQKMDAALRARLAAHPDAQQAGVAGWRGRRRRCARRDRRSGPFARARMRFARSTRQPSSSVRTSPRVRCRSSWSAPSGSSPKTSCRCSPISRRMPSLRRVRRAESGIRRFSHGESVEPEIHCPESRAARAD